MKFEFTWGETESVVKIMQTFDVYVYSASVSLISIMFLAGTAIIVCHVQRILTNSCKKKNAVSSNFCKKRKRVLVLHVVSFTCVLTHANLMDVIVHNRVSTRKL